MPRHKRERAFFTAQVVEEILRRIMEGESLLRICGPDRQRGMPDRITVHRRLREDRAFRAAYMLAREAQAERLAWEVIEIADGRMTPKGETPNVGRDWLRVQTRKWLVGVMAPRSYGKLPARDELWMLDPPSRTRDDLMDEVTPLLEEVAVMAEAWAHEEGVIGAHGALLEDETALLEDMREGVGGV